ncbi:hypothetical protein ABH931_000401 [Streptacidiphilus sp. MAP12-33]|uniref:hypothetical protein n=1 Tax=Streptacidiphilus sp. MAP12-33 TaxID=3156266 RepID=UPI0035138C61
MSALSGLGTGAARAAGTALAAGLLVAAAVTPVWALGAADAEGSVPLKAKPGGARASHPTGSHPIGSHLTARPGAHRPVDVTVRLPDGRLLHFTSVPSETGGAPGSGAPASGPSSGPGPSSTTSPPPSGASEPPGGDGSASAVPVPVVSSLFPSPVASGSPSHRRPRPTSRPSRGAVPAHPAVTPQAAQGSGAPAVAPQQGGDAVPPPAGADRPASTVPPPLGPQAVLQPDAYKARLADPHTTSVADSLARRGLLLGVGLALIGTGAALFGWRIRRL